MDILWWMNKNKIQCFFYDDTGGMYRKIVKPVENKFKIRFQGRQHRYLIDGKCVYYDHKKHLPTLHYYVGNPSPILLKYKEHPEANSVSLNNVMEDKSIQDLFSNDTMKELLLLILVCANMLISGIMLVKVMGFF